jgi:hypothetical protein
MTLNCFCLWGGFFLMLLVPAQTEQQRIPPGIQKAVQMRTLPTEPPLGPQRQKVDPAELKRGAEELARLAQDIPPEVEQLTQGRFPKDLEEKLKRIEKLSKQLRYALSP